MRPVRVVITNTVALNSGDAAILLATKKALQQAFGELDLVALDSQADVASRLYPEIRFEQLELPARGRVARKLHAFSSPAAPLWLPLSQSLRANQARYRWADLIVSTGGTLFVEHYDLLNRFYQLETAFRTKKPVVFYTQSLGPFRRWYNVFWVRRLIKKASLVFLRDQRSLDNLRAVGAIPKRSIVSADSVSSLARLESIKKRALEQSERSLRVGVSVRAWKHFRAGRSELKSADYNAAVAATIIKLVTDHHAEVTFLSSCQGVPEYHTDDSAAAQKIVELLPQNIAACVRVDKDFRRPEQLIDALSRFDFVLATRMHIGILALCGGTPVIPIAYEFKTAELFKAMGLADWVIDIEDALPSTLPDKVIAFLEGLPQLRARMMAAVEEQHHSAMGTIDALRELLPLIRAETGRKSSAQ